MSKRLITEHFDKTFDLNFPFDKIEEINPSAEKTLDLMLLYMRKVHGYCLYCGLHCEDEHQLAQKCGSHHLRATVSVAGGNVDVQQSRDFESRFLVAALMQLNKDHSSW